MVKEEEKRNWALEGLAGNCELGTHLMGGWAKQDGFKTKGFAFGEESAEYQSNTGYMNNMY